MRKLRLGLLVVAGAALLLTAAQVSAGNFVAHLDQDQTVPAVTVASHATGQLVVKNRDGELSYKFLVAGLQNARAAHIHCGQAGELGPAGVNLFGPSAPIDVNGILAQGPIAGPIPGNACGWIDNVDVIDAINDGNAYVNIHTSQNPPSEIRGQLE